MSLSTVAKNLSLAWAMTKLSILSALEYRAAFMTQVIGMFINDFLIIGSWYVMFLSFPIINGWRFEDMIILFALVMMQYAIMGVFLGGFHHLAKTIINGNLDYYLSFPQPVLWHVLISRTDVPAIGDGIVALLLFFFFSQATLLSTIAFIVMAVVSSAILLNMYIIVQSITFFIGNFEEVVYQYQGILNSFAFAPQSVFSGTIKWLMATIFPAIFVVSFPASLIKNWDWIAFIYTLSFWGISFIVAQFIFQRGLRRYESGNLIHVND